MSVLSEISNGKSIIKIQEDNFYFWLFAAQAPSQSSIGFLTTGEKGKVIFFPCAADAYAA